MFTKTCECSKLHARIASVVRLINCSQTLRVHLMESHFVHCFWLYFSVKTLFRNANSGIFFNLNHIIIRTAAIDSFELLWYVPIYGADLLFSLLLLLFS